MKIKLLKFMFISSLIESISSKLVDINGKEIEYIADKNFKIFSQKFLNMSETFMNSPLYQYSHFEKIFNNELITEYYTGQLWKHLNVIHTQNRLKLIDLFGLDEPTLCNDKLDWFDNKVSNFIHPNYLYELHEEEKIAIKCPYTCMKTNLSETRIFEWYNVKYNKTSINGTFKVDPYFELVEYSERIYLDYGFTLYIKDFLEIDSGSYFCKPSFKNVTNLIYFNLFLKLPFEKRENVILYSNLITSKFNKSNVAYSFLPNEYLTKGYYKDSENEIFVQPMWTEWSLCGDCDKKSMRNRLGDCVINYNDTLNSELSYIQRIYYPNGGPCYLNVFFNYLSDAFLSNDIFKNYNFHENCFVNCSNYQFENDKTVNDKLFDFDEDPVAINNDAAVAEEVDSKVVTNKIERYKGDNVKLLCLDFKFERSIEWKKNDITIKKEKASNHNKTKFINEFNEYEMNKLRLMDSGVYKCLYKDRIVAVVELIVLSKISTVVSSIDDNYKYYVKFLVEIFRNVSCLILISMVFKAINVKLIKIRMKKREIMIR